MSLSLLIMPYVIKDLGSLLYKSAQEIRIKSEVPILKVLQKISDIYLTVYGIIRSDTVIIRGSCVSKGQAAPPLPSTK